MTKHKFEIGDIILYDNKEVLIKGLGRDIRTILCYGFCKPTETNRFIKSRYSNTFTGFNENASCSDVDEEATLISTIFDIDAYCFLKEELKNANEESVNVNKRIDLLEQQIESIKAIDSISGLKVIIDRKVDI